MSSLVRARLTVEREEGALYLATAVALSAALLCVGWGSGSPRVGLFGSGLVAMGVGASWHLRRWERSRRLLLGVLLGSLAGGSLHALISWEIAAEIGLLYQSLGYIGLSIALRMAVLLVGFSFVLPSRDTLPFCLVPAISLFGLVGGRGTSMVVFACFLVFLPTALVSIGQAMTLSGMPANWRSGESPSEMSRWRPRHWLMLSVLILGILLLGTLIYIPALTYGTQYYWQLTMMSFNTPGLDRFARPLRLAEPVRTYSVGRGPVAPTERPLLSFEGEPAPLWRGEVYDIYTGTAWRSSDELPLPLRVVEGSMSVERLFPPTSQEPLRSHTVRAEDEIPLVLYSPGQIQQAALPAELGEGLRGRISIDKFGCVVAPGATLTPGTTYRLLSDPAAFARASGRAPVEPGTAPLQELEESYLRIPLSSRRVATLARRVTADAETQQEKLLALVSHLQGNYAYTLGPPATPLGEDAVDYFVFRSRRGYCDLFASALAIMGRAVGVPTRFVTGFAGGQYDAESGRYVLRESDMHAWVEAYVDGYGWVAVDPAPGGDLPPLPPMQRALLAIRFFRQDHPVLAGTLLAAMVAALVVIVILVRRARGETGLLSPDRSDPRSVVLRGYARLGRMLGRTGRPRRPSQTPSEYLSALAVGGLWRSRPREPLSADVLAPARSLTEVFLLARYGARPVTAETASLALRWLEEAQSALARPQQPRA